MQIPRPEHPKPQFQRQNWMNLNGLWQFEIDNSRSGLARGLAEADAGLSGQILVPFCPESELSGVAHKDFMLGLWYRRTVELTANQCAGRVFLHFGAVDYQCHVYVNGKAAGSHKGGYVSFKLEITNLVHPGENVITVNALDDTRDPMITRGKQCEGYYSARCDYTRTTGIWQTVWLEFTPKSYIKAVRMDGDPRTGQLLLTAQLEGSGVFAARAFYKGQPVGSIALPHANGQLSAAIQLDQIHLWEPGHGRLYDLELIFGEDRVESYFGLRTIRMDGLKFRINEKSVFQRLILDQGFYPGGVYTAPSDADLCKDIELSMAMGFNGARLHEKIFEERFLYHCDRLGYLVWGEYPNWGLDHSYPEAIYAILPEWIEEVQRDYNHPSIIGWCPFNETWDKHNRQQYDDLIRQVYRTTKALDPGRPCIDTSGHFHVETDIYDVHDYEQEPTVFAGHFADLKNGKIYERNDELVTRRYPKRQTFPGGPMFVSEFGGARMSTEKATGDRNKPWGYGENVADTRAFFDRFKGLVDVLLDNDCIFGFCYTQLTDIEQEQNGLYTFDRRPKLDPAQVNAAVSRKAAIEE